MPLILHKLKHAHNVGVVSLLKHAELRFLKLKQDLMLLNLFFVYDFDGSLLISNQVVGKHNFTKRTSTNRLLNIVEVLDAI